MVRLLTTAKKREEEGVHRTSNGILTWEGSRAKRKPGRFLGRRAWTDLAHMKIKDQRVEQ